MNALETFISSLQLGFIPKHSQLAAGLVAHPYTIAVDLGRSIRFKVPLPEVVNQLESMKPKEITV